MVASGTKAADELAGRLMLVSALLFSIALASITLAHIFQRYGGYLPCHLCLQERYAYYFGVPASIARVLRRACRTFSATRILLVLIALAFLANAVLGIYHSGVEWKWWAGPTECSGGSVLSCGAGGVDIANAKVIACDEAAWRMLGLSFAGWNAVVSAFLAGLAAFGASLRR